MLIIGGAGTALAAPPPNDNLAAATPITSLPFSDTVDTTELTTEASETPTCASGTFTSVQATLLQRRGARLIRLNAGYALPTTCDGLAHTVTLVFEDPGPFALKKGKAVATATIVSYGSFPLPPVTVDVGPVDVRLRKSST